MDISVSKRVEELLHRWEASRQQGQHLSAEELCADDPDLLATLRQRIDECLSLAEFLAGAVLTLIGMGGIVAGASGESDRRDSLRSLSWVVAFLIPFSLIPGIAFYPALPTVACFFLLCSTLAGLLAVRVAARLFGSPREFEESSWRST